MTRTRLLFAFGLLAAFGLVVGCGKKGDPDVVVDPTPRPPTPGSSTEAAAKYEAVKRLKEIGKALHEYHDSLGQFPVGIVGPKGELGLSWRVQLLPYLGEDGLYRAFNMKEPWDSE